MTEQMKLCVNCLEVKNLTGGFYKAGASWQKLCKHCHNKNRSTYISSNIYTKVPKGFAKLDTEIKNNILKDISERINYKDISIKYDIKYQTLLTWKRKDLIK